MVEPKFDERVKVLVDHLIDIDADIGVDYPNISTWSLFDMDNGTLIDILVSPSLGPLVYYWTETMVGELYVVAVDSEEEFVKLLEEASGTSL